MKQPKVATTPLPAPAPAILRGPRYRYFSTPPTKVTLRLRDLHLPERARTAAYDSEQFVDLSCEDIFRSGPVPKIRLARLAELAPDCVTAESLPDEGIKVCSARLALAYALVEGRELLEEPPAPELPPAPVSEPFAPPAGVGEEAKIIPPPQAAEPLESAPPDPEFRPRRSWLEAYRTRKQSSPADTGQSPSPVEEAAPAPEASVAGPAREVTPVAKSPEPAEAAAPVPPSVELIPPAPAVPPEPPAASLPDPQEGISKSDLPDANPSPLEEKKPFSLFPKFRRNEAVGPKPSVLIPRSRIEIPKPKRPFIPAAQPPAPLPSGESEATARPSQPPLPLAADAAAMASIPPPPPRITPEPPKPSDALSAEPAPAQETPARPAEALPPLAELPPPPPALTPPVAIPDSAALPIPPAEESAPELPPAAPEGIRETPAALLVETEHLTKEQDRPEIPEQDALQAIFLTEEFLSVDRVLELCGNLPGIRSCVLSSGANVIASHNAPDSMDIVSLSAHALEMIKAMRASAAKMGIGAVPAVTVHSEKGPITFFHQDDLCLLVLHKDRGFVPGVREKLEQVVHELSEAKLPLRLGQGAGKKMLPS